MLMWIGCSELVELKLELELELDVQLPMVDSTFRYSGGSIFVSCRCWTLWFALFREVKVVDGKWYEGWAIKKCIGFIPSSLNDKQAEKKSGYIYLHLIELGDTEQTRP